ncbi:branched-chain amino acid ABC transporter permease [Variovorax sp. J22P271]|uniref:branched-chain amino acid ABC transporter permease n=1 Tax=Variovorax davisae TaxID=3053515 RepID=UPI002577BF7D|nr:branched-chain amino acid ABC transporter permease [Variovorax sp. J22P271]MDM0032513.1 branched-chain amino acid ABC transporter permease [Variovorax sp. J22P271]
MSELAKNHTNNRTVGATEFSRFFHGTPALVLAMLLAIAAVLLLQGYWAFKLSSILILALAVRSLQLLIGTSGQISLGHGAFFAVGAYTAGMLLSPQWLPAYATVPAAMVVCGLLGLLFGLPATRLSGPYLALATFALAVALPQLLKHPLLEPLTGGVSGLSLDPVVVPFGFLGLQADQWNLLQTAVWTFLIYGVLRRLLAGPAGLAWLTLRDHPTAATAVGVDVRKWRVAAFAVSSAAVGAAGALNTNLTNFVSPDSFTVFLSLSLLVGVALAGSNSGPGTLVAAVFLSLVPDIAEKVSQELTGVLYGCVMLAAVFVVPLFGKWRRRAAVAAAASMGAGLVVARDSNESDRLAKEV